MSSRHSSRVRIGFHFSARDHWHDTVPTPVATLEDWDQSFGVNGKGVFLCYKYAAKRMIQQGRGGRIIGACSSAGKQGEDCYDTATLGYMIIGIENLGNDLLTVYSATKFTVRSLTQSAGGSMMYLLLLVLRVIKLLN